MAPTIRVDDDIFEHLKKNSSFVDTPSDVLRRLLNITKQSTPSNTPTPSINRTRHVLQADHDYANVPITSFEFEGRQRQVRTYKDVLLAVCETLRSRHGDQFDNFALTLRGKKRDYFSWSDSGMKHPRQVSGVGATKKDLYIETNLSATSIMGLCQHLIRHFRHDESSFKVH